MCYARYSMTRPGNFRWGNYKGADRDRVDSDCYGCGGPLLGPRPGYCSCTRYGATEKAAGDLITDTRVDDASLDNFCGGLELVPYSMLRSRRAAQFRAPMDMSISDVCFYARVLTGLPWERHHITRTEREDGDFCLLSMSL